jgi:hypothetical protein
LRPTGAVAADWDIWSDAGGRRQLEGQLPRPDVSRHDTADASVAVGGAQYGDGRFDCYVLFYWTAALPMAVAVRGGLARPVIFHADQGTQYISG